MVAGHWFRSIDFTTDPPTIGPIVFEGAVTGDTAQFCSVLAA
jgi:hypothetical protein